MVGARGALAFDAWQVGAAPGDDDGTFVPITACRLADTRPEPDRFGDTGAFGTDDTKTFDGRGATGNLTIPSDASGLALNVTAVTATLPTFLTVWPGGTMPLASSLNPAPGQPPTPNAVNVVLADDGTFRMYNLQGVVEAIIDVTGYYTPSSLLEIGAELDRIEDQANRSVGHTLAVIDFPNGSGSSNVGSPVVGVQVVLETCETGVINCVEMESVTFGESDVLTGHRFDGSTRGFRTFRSRLTNGVEDVIRITTRRVRQDGMIGTAGAQTLSELAVFRRDQVSSGAATVDLDGLTLESITLVAAALVFDPTPGDWSYSYSFEIYFELPGAPAPPAPSG